MIIEDSKAAHTAGEWIIDTPATATTSGSKHKECTVCSYTMTTETIPATGGGEHTHSYGSDWKYDADNHWHECSCGDKADKAAHDSSGLLIRKRPQPKRAPSMRSARFAATRRRQLRFWLPAPQQNRPILRKQLDNDRAEGPKTGDNSNMILWIALLFISGGAVIGITVYSKRRKKTLNKSAANL